MKTANTFTDFENEPTKNVPIFPYQKLEYSHISWLNTLDEKTSLLNCLSMAIFQTKDQAQRIRLALSLSLVAFFQDQDFPKELEFLKTEADVVSFHGKHGSLSLFDNLNIMLASKLFNICIEVITIQPHNQNFYSSFFNPLSDVTCYLYVDSNKNYMALERPHEDEQKQKIKSALRSKCLQTLMTYESIYESKAFEFQKLLNNPKSMHSLLDEMTSEDIVLQNHLSLILSQNLKTFYDVLLAHKELTIQEMAISSAHGVLSRIFTSHTKDISKSVAKTDKSTFNFNVPSTQDIEGLFNSNNNYISHPANAFFNTKPPGILNRSISRRLPEQSNRISQRADERNISVDNTHQLIK
jgi:hypothetical protein